MGGVGAVLLQHFSIGEPLRILGLKISKIRTLFRTTPALNFITLFRTRDKLACEQQTHFRRLREATTGNASAVRRLRTNCTPSCF